MANYSSHSLETDNLAESIIITEINDSEDTQETLLMKIKEAELSLKRYEVVSIMFFLHNNAKKTLIDLDNHLNGVKSNLIYKWCVEANKNFVCTNADTDDWESKFYECLFLIKNYKLLKQFNIEAVNAVHHFNHKYLIPNIRVHLYKICENIVGLELESLLQEMGESDFRYKDYLEMYFLKWISSGKISIDSEIDIGPLNNCLKSIGRDEFILQLRPSQNLNSSLETSFRDSVNMDPVYTIIDPSSVGLCVIINQKNFKKDPQNPALTLKERKGTEKDCESLKNTLRKFKFDTETINDVESTQIIKVIQEKVHNFFKPNHSIFLLIILSHGHQGVIFGTDSKPVQIISVDYCLLLPQLKDKPKVIIVQACQGDFYVKASKIESDAPVKEWPKDTLFCMATIPFFASYRHLDKGTWYIQTLCEILEKYPEEKITDLLIRVNNVLYNQPVFGSEVGLRSIPEYKCRLDKALYFKRKEL